MHNKSYISGFRLLNVNNVVICEEIANLNDKATDVVLEKGERLLGVKSKRYTDSGNDTLAHCNLVLVLGKME